MNQTAEIYFKYQENYYSCVATVFHSFEDNCVYVEFVDAEIIDMFETEVIKYVGESGYNKLPEYNNRNLRPLLLHLVSLVQSMQHIFNNKN